jgi:hypothetical protein
MSTQHLDAREIAAKGLDIYERKYRAEFEEQYNGAFAAIDISSEAIFLADLPEDALSKARAASPEGLFFLLRVGSPGAFKRLSLTREVGITTGGSM